MPSRLLDLDADLDSGDICLVLTSDIGTQNYATLSYSWGNRASVLLTKDTLEAFQARIVTETLPKTIQHAIKVCRGLQVKYLWVDALCIIQGNSKDFASEVSQMGSIYAKSLLTIVASNAVDCSLGCFEERQPLQVEDCQILDDGENTVFFAGTDHDNSYHYLRDRHLDTRAWVYQERMMSPRTVHFCGSEIVWECRERLTCQRCAVSPQPSRGVPNDGDHKPLFTRISQMRPEDLEQAKFEDIWYEMLSVYTKALLSNEDDRLSALAGMVQLLNRHTKHENSFGLWLPFFLDQLLWCYWSGQRGAWQDRKDTPGLPSWSWVSVRGGVGRLQYALRGQTQVYSAELTQAPPDTSFGQISSLCTQLPLPVSTRIRGWATACRSVPVFRHYENFTPPKEWAISPVSKPCSDELAAFQQLTWNLFLGDTAYTKEQADFLRETPLWRQYYYPDAQPKQHQHLVCLLIKRIWEQSRNKWNAGEMVEYGLVLERVDGNKNLFQRRGVYTGYSGRDLYKVETRYRLKKALESKDEHSIRQAQEDHDSCTEIFKSEDEQRIQKLFKDRYSLFNEEEPMVQVEII